VPLSSGSEPVTAEVRLLEMDKLLDALGVTGMVTGIG
jgi:hypothetical protein